MVTIVNADNFQAEVLDSKTLVVADFWAAWCAPCRMLAPIIEQLSEEMDNVKFVKIDTEKNQELAQKYQVTGIPNIKFFKGGELIGEFVGLAPKPHYETLIRQYLEK